MKISDNERIMGTNVLYGGIWMLDDTWRKTLQECVVHDLLFKALMADKEALQEAGLKLRYEQMFETLSLIAEKRHHQLREDLRRTGCRIVSKQNKDGYYVVQCRVRGYLEEAVFSGELLKAECEVRLANLIGRA